MMCVREEFPTAAAQTIYPCSLLELQMRHETFLFHTHTRTYACTHARTHALTHARTHAHTHTHKIYIIYIYVLSIHCHSQSKIHFIIYIIQFFLNSKTVYWYYL